MGRILILGDIHGQLKALEQVFLRAKFDFENDQCIFIGDIVDRGHEPFECVSFMLKIKNLITIAGNHDLNLREWIRTGHDGLNGKHGVWITKKKWSESTDETKKMVSQYFGNMMSYYVDEQRRMFTHGGFHEEYSIKEQNEWDFAWNRELWNSALCCKDDEKVKTFEKFSEIYIGHTPTINYGVKEETTMSGIILNIGEPITIPIYSGGIWNVDTGAGFVEGKLTLMDIETKEIFQSDLIGKLYE